MIACILSLDMIHSQLFAPVIVESDAFLVVVGQHVAQLESDPVLLGRLVVVLGLEVLLRYAVCAVEALLNATASDIIAKPE